MNREIKVRAYDEETEFMFYSDKPVDDYFFAFGDEDNKLKGFVVRDPRPSSDPMEPAEPYCDEYPVEQFTGLKDKNGKEIYENSKIQGHGEWGNVSCHKVVFLSGSFGVSVGERFVELSCFREIELIHENKEL